MAAPTAAFDAMAPENVSALVRLVPLLLSAVHERKAGNYFVRPN
jgi:hypothetical protein